MSGLSGLHNMGNTCYLNSIIQCISNCEPFKNYILSSQFIEQLVIKYDNNNMKKYLEQSIAFQLCRIIKALWKKDNCTLTINSFKELLGYKVDFFSGQEQHDSQEVLICIIGLVHDEFVNKRIYDIEYIDDSVINYMNIKHKCDKVIDNTKSERLKQWYIEEFNKYKNSYENRDVLTLLQSYTMWSEYKTNNNSIVTDLFTGLLYSQLSCLCNYRTNTFEPFTILSLPIPNGPRITIYDCLNEFCKDEILDDDNKWACPNCKNMVNAQKSIRIWHKPQILIIQLKRFSSNTKISARVDFPLTEFDINHIISPINNAVDDRKYELFAINLHIGNMNGGHYFSYCKNDLGWYEFNDDICTRVVERQLCNSGAYLLFYKLV